MPDRERSADAVAAPPHDGTSVHDIHHEARSAERFEEEIDLGRYIRPLRRHWKLLVAGAVLGAVVGLVVSNQRPVLYEASTTLLMHQDGSAAAFSTSRALLVNYTLAAETIQETGLDKDPYRLTPQAFVEKVLAVEEIAGTTLLRVKARLPDRTLAMRASQVLSDKAVELNRRVVLEGNTTFRNQLKVLLDDATARMKSAEERLLAQRSQSQVELLKKDMEVMLAERGDLLKLLIDIEVEKSQLAAAEKEIEKQQPVLSIRRAVESEDALRRAAGQPQTPGAARPEFLDLSNPFVNPVYQTLAYQIAIGRTRLAGLERERREIVAVRNPDRARFSQLTDLYKSEIQIERLQNDYDLAKRVFSELTVRYEQSRTESVGSMVQLQIVDRAFPPERPMPRKRAESTLLGLTAGLFVAALLALAVNREHERAGAVPGRSS